MDAASLTGVSAIQLVRHGTVHIVFADGSTTTTTLSRPVFSQTSSIAFVTVKLDQSSLHLITTRGDAISVELPEPDDPAPTRGRTTVYLDQNHLSTVTMALHQPTRISDTDERAAALDLVERALRKEVLLPISSALPPGAHHGTAFGRLAVR